MKVLICGGGLLPLNMERAKEGGVQKYSRDHSCGLWPSIREGCESFSKHMAFMVGDGTCILFWHDRWVGDNPLNILYLELFEYSENKLLFSEVLCHQVNGTESVWNLRFYRDFHD